MDRRWAAVLLVVVAAAATITPAVVRGDEATSSDIVTPPKVEETLGGAMPDGMVTDHTTKQREDEAMAHSGLSIKERKQREGAQQFEFQAEISRLMDIIINSLYSNKDIFLRELISNGSDALDKIRFLSLTDTSALGDGDTSKLEIRISLDKENKVLSIRDRGVGMTKQDLITNLGTIAKSGTSSFLEQMQKGGDLNLIGQFGVGFYSAYLVSDYVQVITKHNNDTQYIWESGADGSFSVLEDTENEPLGRGTLINLHLKEEAQEYLEEEKLKELVSKYSEFINFPIYLLTTKEVDVEVPVEEGEEDETDEGADGEEDEEASDEDDVEVTDEEEEEEEEKPKTKTIKETKKEWELLNDNKALWLRNPKDVTEEEYKKFYKALTKDYQEPLAYSHFTAEGDVEFKAILYIPPSPPVDLFENYYTKVSNNLKLYVRRVFISDEFQELLPKYLTFLKGIVDSDTLPLNVSREMLQAHSSLLTIKKKLVRKALAMIKEMADEDAKIKKEKAEKAEKEDTEEKSEEENDDDDEPTQYEKFWSKYHKAIKLGIIEDSSNRMRLAKLLRFHTSKSPDKLVSLDEYIANMKSGQKHIYYLAGETQAQLAESPFVERLVKKGYEVIYFVDPIDEYCLQSLTEYEDKKFQNVSKEDLKIGEKSDKQKEKEKALRSEFKSFTKWWKEAIGSDDVEDVKISNRLSTTPCVVVTGKWGWSANMERIMKSQAMADDSRTNYMKSKKTLEINPRHPIIKELKAKVDEDAEFDGYKSMARLLYDTALLESGFSLDDTKSFAARMAAIMKSTLKIDPAADVIEEEEEEEETPATGETADGESNDDDDDDEPSPTDFFTDETFGDSIKISTDQFDGGEDDARDEL